MTFEELRSAARAMPCQVISDAVAHYFEGVFVKGDLPALVAILETYFGAPRKPAGEPTTPEIDKCSGRYGGAETNQTLYVHQKESGIDVALLWPWTGGERTTLKLIRG